MTRRTTALVVEHIAEEGSGAFAEWLPAAGLDLDVRLVQRDGLPALDGSHDALVVMGGAMGVPDGDAVPWLRDELRLVRDAISRNVPVLGICLGAQLLAAACGGVVTRGRLGPEVGLRRVHLTGLAEADPLLHGLPPIAEAVQWHWDEIVTLPTGTAHLGGSPMYPHQAFRLGDTAWGLQFHPEAHPGMVRRWAVQDAAGVRAAGEDPEAHARDVERAWPDLAATWRQVAERFAGVVRDVAATAAD